MATENAPSRLAERLKRLGHIASLVNTGSELSEVLELIAMSVCQRTTWSSSAIVAVDHSIGYCILVARHDPYFQARPPHKERWLLETSPTRHVINSGKPLIIPDVQATAEYPEYQREGCERDYRTVLLAPLHAVDLQGRPMVLAVHSHEQHNVDEDELAFLLAAANVTSLALERAHRLHMQAQHALRLRHAIEVHSVSMAHVLAGETLATIIDTIMPSLPNPLMIVDLTSNQVIARGSPAPTLLSDAEWQRRAAEIGVRGFAHFADLAQPSGFSQRHQVHFGRRLGNVDAEAIVEPIIVDRVTLGYMILFTTGSDLDAFHALVADEARFAVAVHLMRAHIRFGAQAETHGEFLNRLFSGNWRDYAETVARAGHLGLFIEQPARIVVFALSEAETALLSASCKSDVERALLRASVRHAPGATAFFDGDAFVVFLPERTDSGTNGSSSSVARMLEDMQWITHAKVIAAVSRRCCRLEDYPAARQECTRLVALARRLDRGGLVTEADFGPLIRLFSTTENGALQRFIDDTLGTIAAHDDKHHSALLQTAEAFLDSNCRYQACADALGIHVTTLRYRLRRLEELFGVMLEDREMRLALEVALRLRATIEPDLGRRSKRGA